MSFKGIKILDENYKIPAAVSSSMEINVSGKYGNNSTADGTITKPFASMAAGIAAFSGLSSVNQGLLRLLPGTPTDLVDVVLPQWVNVIGSGKYISTVPVNLTYTAPASDTFNGYYSKFGMASGKAFTLNEDAANPNVTTATLEFYGSFVSSGLAGATNHLELSEITSLSILAGGMILDNNHSVANLTIADGVGTTASTNIRGGVLSGSLTMTGNSSLTTVGCAGKFAPLSITANGNGTPTLSTDLASSRNLNSFTLNNLAILELGESRKLLASGVTSYNLRAESYVQWDSSNGGNLNLNLPSFSNYTRRLTIQTGVIPSGGSQGTITLVPQSGETINNRTGNYVLSVPNASITLTSNGFGWFIANYFMDISARYFASSTSISGSLSTISWTTKDWDTAKSMSSGVYTIFTPGRYQVNARLAVSASFSVNNSVDLQLQKNGTNISEDKVYAFSTDSAITTEINDIVTCENGDTLRVQVSTDGGSPAIVGSNFQNYISIMWLGDGGS